MVSLSARVIADAPHRSDVVASPTPAIGWETDTSIRDWLQARAEIRVLRESGINTVAFEGSDSVRQPWPFAPLAPREQVQLQVRTIGVDGSESDWSDPVGVVAGFLADGEWTATPIGLDGATSRAQPAYFRREFVLPGDIRRAVLYATAVGVYQVAVNGVDVDDQVLKPGWTPYADRLIHETTDVTALLSEGANVLAVRLAGAWATELYGFSRDAEPVFASQPSFAAQLHIEHADGRTEIITTGRDWRAHAGALVSSSLYDGETYDARAVLRDNSRRTFSQPGFDDSDWGYARTAEPMPIPEARTAPFVRRIEEVPVREVLTSASGKIILDFGQNLVGRLRIRVHGPAGTTVTLRHAEVLEHGELGVRPLRRAQATDRYTLDDSGPQEWEPEFTFHGFRYAQIEGWPGDLSPEDVTAVVIHSDMERTGWFSTSHPLLDRLHENVVWGLRGNFLSIPTDCPQRDERLGWTGDIQVFAPTASFLYDVRGFLDSWLRDLAIEQNKHGGVVPFVVPNVLSEVLPATAWGDAATIVPWVLHERYQDTDTLRRQYDSMRSWVDAIAGLAGPRHLWEGGFQYGDWLDPDAPPEFPERAKTSADVVASAYLFRSARAVADAAHLLGHQEDALAYGALADEVREAFAAEYITPAGRMMSDAQTAYALAVVFGICQPEQEAELGARLAELVREAGYRIGTGVGGTPDVQGALTRTGHLDVATRLLLQTECPSWLYPVTMGATTIWERWDSMLPDGSVNPGEMTSFNHYALGAVADWLHRVVAGLAPAEPGYRRLRIAPQPLHGLDTVKAEHRTPYGLARVAWERADGHITVKVTVPANTRAIVELPDGRTIEVGSGDHEWTTADSTPPVVPGTVDLDTDLRAIIDDIEAYRTVMAVLDTEDPSTAAAARSNTTWSPRHTLRNSVLRLATTAVREAVTQRLTILNESRAR